MQTLTTGIYCMPTPAKRAIHKAECLERRSMMPSPGYSERAPRTQEHMIANKEATCGRRQLAWAVKKGLGVLPPNFVKEAFFKTSQDMASIGPMSLASQEDQVFLHVAREVRAFLGIKLHSSPSSFKAYEQEWRRMPESEVWLYAPTWAKESPQNYQRRTGRPFYDANG